MMMNGIIMGGLLGAGDEEREGHLLAALLRHGLLTLNGCINDGWSVGAAKKGCASLLFC